VGNFVTCLLKNILELKNFWRGKSSPSDQKGYFVTWLLKNILELKNFWRGKSLWHRALWPGFWKIYFTFGEDIAYDTELCDLSSENIFQIWKIFGEEKAYDTELCNLAFEKYFSEDPFWKTFGEDKVALLISRATLWPGFWKKFFSSEKLLERKKPMTQSFVTLLLENIFRAEKLLERKKPMTQSYVTCLLENILELKNFWRGQSLWHRAL
jgi:hypothetical protein